MWGRLFLAMYALYATGAAGLTVYNCASDRIKTFPIDLTAPQTCPDPKETYEKPVNRTAQIFQMNTKEVITATQCVVTLSRDVSFCGLGHLTYSTVHPVWMETRQVTPKACLNMKRNRTFKFDGRTFKITPETDNRFTYYSHGSVDDHGYCETKDFIRNNKLYEDAYEHTTLTVRVANVIGTVDLAYGTVTFHNGLKERVAAQVLHDGIEGTLVWKEPKPTCTETLSHIYTGTVDIHQAKEGTGYNDLVLVDAKVGDEEIFGGFSLRHPITVCGLQCFATQIDGIVCCVMRPLDKMLPKTAFKAQHDQLAADLKSQLGFLHVSNRLQTFQKLRELQSSMCLVDRRTLYNKLQALSGAQNGHALIDLLGRGHQVTVAGAVAYVTLCESTNVIRADWPNCTEEIPVQLGSKVKFADPITLVLQDYPTTRVCNEIAPIRWQIGHSWYCASPKVMPCEAPQQLNLTINKEIQMPELDKGIANGIFSRAQRDVFEKFLNDVPSRKAVVQDSVNRMTDEDGNEGVMDTSGKFSIAIPEMEVDKLVQAVGVRLSFLFQWFGELGYYIFGCIFLATIMVSVFAAAFRMWQIFQVRGCGLWVFAGLWAATTHLALMPVAAAKKFFNLSQEQQQLIIARIDAVSDAATMELSVNHGSRRPVTTGGSDQNGPDGESQPDPQEEPRPVTPYRQAAESLDRLKDYEPDPFRNRSYSSGSLLGNYGPSAWSTFRGAIRGRRTETDRTEQLGVDRLLGDRSSGRATVRFSDLQETDDVQEDEPGTGGPAPSAPSDQPPPDGVPPGDQPPDGRA